MEKVTGVEVNPALFYRVVDELLDEGGMSASEIFRRTTIVKSTWYRKKGDNSGIPELPQLLELCELLKTNLNYLLFGTGPRQSSPAMVDRMTHLVDAFVDDDHPDKRIIIDRIISLNKHDALIAIRKVTHAVIDSFATAARLRGEDPNEYLIALARHSTD